MTERQPYIDILKSGAIVAVVALHVSGTLFYQYGTIPMDWWWTAHVVDSLSRWAVPVFLMCSGALMLGAEETGIREFLVKRARRVVVPLLFWSVAYYFFRHLRGWASPEILVQEAKAFLEGGVYYHLRFLYYLLGLYLVTPMLQVFVRHASKNLLRYVLVLWFAGTVLYPAVARYAGITIGIPLGTVSGFVGYFLLGHYVHAYGVSRATKAVSVALGALGLALTVVGTYVLTARASTPDEHFYEYLNAAVILPSIMVFVLARSGYRPGRLEPAIRSWSDGSFGIYLVHPIVMAVMARLGVSASLVHPLLGIPLTVACVLGLSYAIVYFVRKVPVLRNVV